MCDHKHEEYAEELLDELEELFIRDTPLSTQTLHSTEGDD